MSTITEPTDDWITGSDQPQTTLGTVASGEDLAARTPLGQVTASGKFVAWDPAADDGSQVAVRMSLGAVDATAGDKQAQLIKSGTYNPDLVQWPAGTTAAQKLTAFVGTPISLQLPY
tara:strand:+ start:6158 stop:6508 length:351 start_codon:yes stop_codon:yes gene_type:complete